MPDGEGEFYREDQNDDGGSRDTRMLLPDGRTAEF
jgi:hypothetical protein